MNTQFEVDSWQVAGFDGLCFVGQVCHGEMNGSVLSTTYISFISLEDISMPEVEEQCPTLYDYVYFTC